jgi:hypothetical protein
MSSWRGVLAQATRLMEGWGTRIPATGRMAGWIFTALKECPVDDTALSMALDRVEDLDDGAAAPNDLFDDLYANAYSTLDDTDSYGQFYNDVATYMKGVEIMDMGTEEIQDDEDEEGRWFVPDEGQLQRIADQNQVNIKALKDGQRDTVLQVGEIVLVGGGHDKAETVIANSYGIVGAVKVKKGFLNDPGTLVFTGMYDQDAVRRQMARISAKACEFTD